MKRGRGRRPMKSTLTEQPIDDASFTDMHTLAYKENVPNHENMVITSKSAYEEMRQKRLEENKMRMEELNLNKLAQALHTPKPSTMKRGRERPVDVLFLRRSMRFRDLQPLDYKLVKKNASNHMKRGRGRPKKSTLLEQPVDVLSVRRSVRVRDLQTLGYKEVKINASNHVLDALKRKKRKEMSATQRAKYLESGLDQQIPSFIKRMVHSDIGSMLRIPTHFRTKHLPNHDVTITIVDKQGDEYPTKYLAPSNSLSKGWRRFVTDHQVAAGDVLVFQLIEPTTFKVYIIRANVH